MTELVHIELAAESALLSQIDTAIQTLQRPRELMRDIAAVMEQNVNLRFRTKKDPNGQAWPQLSEMTPLIYASIHETARRGADGELVIPPMPGSLLERTRRMLDSLAGTSGDTWAEAGFSVPYALYHETGTKRNDKPYMPRRGLLTADPKTGTLGAEDRQDIQDEIDDFMERLLIGSA